MSLLFYLNRRPSRFKLGGFTFIALFVLFAVSAYSYWDNVLIQIIEWQRALHEILTQHIDAVAHHTPHYGWALIGVSFAYGIFHAVGPGHGKAVITTYLGTHKESLLSGIGISMSAALIQAVIAIGLVSLQIRLLSFGFADMRSVGNNITMISYILIILLGIFIVGSTLYQFARMHQAKKPKTIIINSLHMPEHSHEHHLNCGCRHAHVPDSKQSWFRLFTIALSMGLRPCSGALIVLIYAQLVGVYSYGVIATLFMGFGTGLSVSILAVVTVLTHNWIKSLITGREKNATRSRHTLTYIRLLGGVVLVLIGWGLLNIEIQINTNHPLM